MEAQVLCKQYFYLCFCLLFLFFFFDVMVVELVNYTLSSSERQQQTPWWLYLKVHR